MKVVSDKSCFSYESFFLMKSDISSNFDETVPNLLAGHFEAVKSPRSCWRKDSRCSVLAGGWNWSGPVWN